MMSSADRKGSRAVGLAAIAALAIAGGGRRSAAWGGTYSWADTGSVWESATNWVGGVVPTSTDTASLDPTNPTLSPVNPVLSGTDSVLDLALDNNALGGTYALSTSGAATLNISTGGIVVRGFGTSTLNGPVLTDKTPANLTFNVGNDAGLTLTGATTALASGAITVSGGTFTCDDSANNLARLSTNNNLTLASGGTFSLIGNGSAATTLSLGTLAISGTTATGGVNTISVTSDGALTPPHVQQLRRVHPPRHRWDVPVRRHVRRGRRCPRLTRQRQRRPDRVHRYAHHGCRGPAVHVQQHVDDDEPRRRVRHRPRRVGRELGLVQHLRRQHARRRRLRRKRLRADGGGPRGRRRRHRPANDRLQPEERPVQRPRRPRRR